MWRWLQLLLPIIVAGNTSVRTQLYRESVKAQMLQVEQAVCISRWRIQHDTIYIDSISPARIKNADALDIWYLGEMCNGQCPSIHWHVKDNGWLHTRSRIDSITAERYPDVPFQILGVGGTHDLIPYSIHSFIPGTYSGLCQLP